MSNITVQSRIRSDLKHQAEAIFQMIGISTADAIRMFLQQCVNSGGLPFQPTAVKHPNTATREALAELEKGGGKTFSNSQDFYNDLGI